MQHGTRFHLHDALSPQQPPFAQNQWNFFLKQVTNPKLANDPPPKHEVGHPQTQVRQGTYG
jgi:hypothetical protein